MQHHHSKHLTLDLEPEDNQRLADLCGPQDVNLRHIENQFSVEIHNRGHHFQIHGHKDSIQQVKTLLLSLYKETGISAVSNGETALVCKRRTVKARGEHQTNYIHNILHNTFSFGIGPAGTGKTYLAVACAVAALEAEQVKRLLLVRPAVEAGEHLGYLPGDIMQKVDPYFRPLYDALYELQGFEHTGRLIEQHVIEVVPLAYMRGRTLNNSFIILDESQNATHEQMKMFLTRIGFGSTVVITGDVTQTDLPKGSHSGLRHAMEILKDIPGISFTYFDPTDIVRHPLVQAIVRAYDQDEASTSVKK